MLYVLIFLVTALYADKTYYDTGELKKEVHYKNGKRHGISTIYYKTGKIKYTAEYVDGKRMNKVYYYSSGKKPLPTVITNSKTALTLLSYGYRQEQNNHFYRAGMAYEKVCDEGNINGCLYLGLLADRLMKTRDMQLKAKVNAYPKAAYALWTKACEEERDAVACRDLGRLYDRKGNYRQAKKYYLKACSSHTKEGCIGLASLYENGKGVKKSRAEALRFLTMACKAKVMSGCYKLGRLHKDYSDFEKANPFFEKACDDGDMKGCASLGLAYEHGLGVKASSIKAKKYYEKACSNDYMFACLSLVRLEMYKALHSKDYSAVIKLKARACEGGIGEACHELGSYYEDVDKTKALEYYEKGCMMLNDELSCLKSKQMKTEMRR